MMTQPLYVEASDEITTVVERLQDHDEATVLLVAPKGAALLQSIVNLKLIKKAARDAGKEVVLVTTDKIGRNLATQIGLPHAASVEEAEESIIPPEEMQDEAHVISGVRIHRYYEEGETEEAAENEGLSPVEPIVPKKLLKEQPEAKPAAQAAEQEVAPAVAATATQADSATTTPVSEAAVPHKTERPETQEPAASTESPGVPSDSAPVVIEKIQPKAAEAVAAQEPKEEPAISRRTITKETDTAAGTAAKPRKKKRKFVWLAFGLVFSLVLISGGVAFLFFPVTDVTATVPATPWKQQYTTVASLNPSAGQIAIKTIATEDSQSLTFKATGTKELGEKAHGTVTVFNSYSSDPQKLVAGTQLTAQGLAFTLDSDVTVPGARVEAGKLVAGSVNATISAVNPGPDSNLSNVPGTVASSTLYIQVVSTTGGSSRKVSIVTDSDIANAKEQLTATLRENIATKLAEAMKGHDYITDPTTDTVTVDAFNYSVKAGDQKDAGVVSGKISANRLALETADVQKNAEQQALSSASANTVIKVKSVTISQQTIDAPHSSATVISDVIGTRSTHVAADDLPQKLTGKTFKEGTDIIHSRVGDRKITITQQPAWWPRSAFPYQNRFIRVHIQYE